MDSKDRFRENTKAFYEEIKAMIAELQAAQNKRILERMLHFLKVRSVELHTYYSVTLGTPKNVLEFKVCGPNLEEFVTFRLIYKLTAF